MSFHGTRSRGQRVLHWQWGWLAVGLACMSPSLNNLGTLAGPRSLLWTRYWGPHGVTETRDSSTSCRVTTTFDLANGIAGAKRNSSDFFFNCWILARQVWAVKVPANSDLSTFVKVCVPCRVTTWLWCELPFIEYLVVELDYGKMSATDLSSFDIAL